MSYRDSHQGRGLDYHRKFYGDTYRALIWDLERSSLIACLAGMRYSRPVKLLDFACGTGRVLAALETHVDVSVGVDVSESMLNIAARNVSRSRLVRADITQANEVNDTFNLITAFRFFPNAEPALRDQAMAALVRRLEVDGVLVFNNHKNRTSIRYLIAALVRRRKQGMGESEVGQLVKAHHLRIFHTEHFGVLPLSDRFPLIPMSVARVFERFATRLGWCRWVASDVMYFCKKEGPSGV